MLLATTAPILQISATADMTVISRVVVLASIITINLHLISSQDDCNALSEVPQHIVWEKQLRKDVIKWDNSIFQPPKSDNCTKVTVKVNSMLVYALNLDTDKGILGLQYWMFLYWNDDRLKWDPSKYGGVENTEISSYRIWTPYFKLLDSVDSDEYDRYFDFTHCNVNSSGLVKCVPRQSRESRCVVNLSNYPYDIQNCSAIFATLAHESNSINMNISTYAIRPIGIINSQWTVYYFKRQNTEVVDKQLKMSFILQRRAPSLVALIVYPSLILSALTIGGLFLDVRKNIRLIIVCFSLFAHLYWLAQLDVYLPKHSTDPPTILLYYRGSMILTVFSLFLSLILTILCTKVLMPHKLLVTVNEFVYGNYMKFIVFPKWDITEVVLDEACDAKAHWIKLCNVINSLLTFVIILAYIGLYCSLMPQPVKRPMIF